MDLVRQALDIFFHLDVHLNQMAGTMGGWLYVLLFAIIFCETGLVVTPVLPGDSLLFAVGALAATEGSPLSVSLLLALLIAAAILGDTVNYHIGKYLGPKVFRYEQSWFFNKKHLLKAQWFYDVYGGKTIFLARFMPLIRTFAPFVAGIGKMSYRRFSVFNVTGGISWVSICIIAGYMLANVELVKRHFSTIIIAIVMVSLMPMVIEFHLSRRRPKGEGRGTRDEGREARGNPPEMRAKVDAL